MNILFITMLPFESNSSAVIQNKGIVTGLIELGNSVDIITLKPNINAISYDDSINDIKNLVRNSYYIEPISKYTALMTKKQSKEFEHVKNNKINGTVFVFKAMIRNIIKKFYDNISIYDAQKSNVNQILNLQIDYRSYDIIISASDPKSSHLIVKKIIENNPNIETKWIQYWGDPMFNDITRKRDWRDRLVKDNEKKLIIKANKIVYASPLTLKIQKETYPEQASKMDYANQVSLNFEKINNTSVNQEDRRIQIGYYGTYYSKFRNIMPLYNAALGSEYSLNICGPSDIKLDSTENINVYGTVMYKEAVTMEKNSDILVTICNRCGTQIPGKIYYCSGYNKPIIVILDGEYQEELREYLGKFNRFILCENEVASIKDAIEKAKRQITANTYIMPEKLTPKFMAKKILGFNLEEKNNM